MEALFRGLTKSGKWVEGFYLVMPVIHITNEVKLEHRIYHNEKGKDGYIYCNPYEVIPETVGMWTGLYDKTGRRIFEGDIVEERTGHKGVVEFGYYELNNDDFIRGCISYRSKDGSGRVITTQRGANKTYVEIIGNVHETKEDK